MKALVYVFVCLPFWQISDFIEEKKGYFFNVHPKALLCIALNNKDCLLPQKGCHDFVFVESTSVNFDISVL